MTNSGHKNRFDILARDNFTCQYCGRKAPDVELEVDHIYPRSKGGYNDEKNLVTACVECNGKKGNTIYRQLFSDEMWEEVNKNKNPFPYGEYTSYIAEFIKNKVKSGEIYVGLGYKTIDKFVKKCVHDNYEFGIIKSRLMQEDINYMRGLILAISKGNTEEEYLEMVSKRIEENEKRRLDNNCPYSEMPNWTIVGLCKRGKKPLPKRNSK